MAELNLKQITDKLNTEFACEERKLIFWYDDNAEFSDEIDNLELENAKIYRLEPDNQFYTKYFLEKEDPETNYLIYAPYPMPDKKENHLLDMVCYSKQFFVDRASLICAELGIDDEYKETIQKYIKFFSAQERIQRFFDIDIEKYNHSTIETGIISAICKIKVSSIEECLRIILAENSINENKHLAEIEKYGLTNAFWNHIEQTFGYSDAEPTLEKLLMCMFITYTAKTIHTDIPVAWKPYISHKSGSIMTFLDTYMNSSVYGDKFDELSYKIYMTIDGHNNLVKLPYECLTDCFIFKGVDEILLSWLIARLENEDTSAKLGERTIPEICLLRRKQHFGKEYRSEYFVIENAYYIIKDAKYSQISDIDEIIKSYTKVWYKIDMRYRYFNFYYDKLSNNTYFEKLRKLIENIYTNDYLNKIITNWCDCFSKSNGRTSLPLQSNFFYSYVEPKKERVCVIISDALRYEVARTLLEKFQADEKCTSSIKAMQSVLPSITQTGMAALLPHKSYTINEKYEACVDGKICDSTQSKNAHCRNYSSKSCCVQYDDLTKMDQQQLREVFTNQDFVYVYHNQIDARGDKANSENEVFVACEEACEEIFKLVKRLTTSANTSRFIITSDHGFMYKRERLYESDKIGGLKNKASVVGKRYALSDFPIECEGIRSYSLSLFYDNKDGFVSAPIGTDIIKASGNGLNYVHGGCSPQEMILPVIEVKTEKSKTETRKASIALVTPIKTITNRIVTLEFLQSDPVTDIVKETTYKVSFVDADNETISNENFIIADKTNKDAIYRLFKLRFNLKDMVFEKSKKYYLIAIDESNGMEAVRIEVVIDIAFAGDFGF